MGFFLKFWKNFLHVREFLFIYLFLGKLRGVGLGAPPTPLPDPTILAGSASDHHIFYKFFSLDLNLPPVLLLFPFVLQLSVINNTDPWPQWRKLEEMPSGPAAPPPF